MTTWWLTCSFICVQVYIYIYIDIYSTLANTDYNNNNNNNNDKNELAKQVAGEMQKTILMDSKSTICKVLSGLIQGENVDEKRDT